MGLTELDKLKNKLDKKRIELPVAGLVCQR